MVTDEEKRAERFQQGLRMEIQMSLIPQQLKTYSQVLTIACDIEKGLEKERSQVMNKTMKKPFLRGFKRIPPV